MNFFSSLDTPLFRLCYQTLHFHYSILEYLIFEKKLLIFVEDILQSIAKKLFNSMVLVVVEKKSFVYHDHIVSFIKLGIRRQLEIMLLYADRDGLSELNCVKNFLRSPENGGVKYSNRFSKLAGFCSNKAVILYSDFATSCVVLPEYVLRM